MAMYNLGHCQIHVLLVDPDPTSLLEVAKLLEVNNYIVTAVQDANLALSMLCQSPRTFDLLMIDVTNNLQGYDLLCQAAKLEATIILMSGEVEPMLAGLAIETGAFLYFQKPATMDYWRNLWQYVYSDKVRKYREELRLQQLMAPKKTGPEPVGTSSGRPAKKDSSTQKNWKKRVAADSAIENNDRNKDNRNPKRTRMCTSWTLALHQKFVAAINELGEGRCYPREILQLMNAPGLTTTQISSHLQRCRLGWKHPEDPDAPPLDIPMPHGFRLRPTNGVFSGTRSSHPLSGQDMNGLTTAPGNLNMRRDVFASGPDTYHFQNTNGLALMPGVPDMGPGEVVPEINNFEAAADASDQESLFSNASLDYLEKFLRD